MITIIRGGVEDTRLEAKDTKKFRGQGHRRYCCSKKKKIKGLQNFFSCDLKKKGFEKYFSAKKGLQKFFSGDLQ